MASAVFAQIDDALPTRVGRVANVQGMLRHSPEGAGWSAIGLNYPVAQGDSLWAERHARAEVDYGGGQFRLGGDTNVHVSRLDEQQLALFVAGGDLIVRVRYLRPEDSVRVDTASTQIALDRPELYRIDVAADPPRTTLIVREGDAAVATADGEESVLPGQIANVSGTQDVTADIREGGGLDGFDTWSAERDRVYESPRANAYVSREMVGEYDLHGYGQWQAYPEYGAVWFPTVDPEWAPYRFGHWTWLPGYGYAWVDSAPWGYAPFHYGRWAYIGGRWGWCPGDFVARPVWAPALVAWYGGGDLFATANGVPVFGWVPLGWGEPFVPWWHCSGRCYARYNRPYAVNVAERPGRRPPRYANGSVPGGITAVPAPTLTTGRPVAINRVSVSFNRPIAPVLTTTPPAIKPAPDRPESARVGNGVPVPAAAYARALPSASLDTPRMSTTVSSAPRSPVVTVPPLRRGSASLPMPAAPQPSVRPVPVPPLAPAPAPIRVPQPAMPLPRMPAPPVPGTSPAPPAAVVPLPHVVPAPVPISAPPLPHPVAPPRPPGMSP
jgi:hypothetical protein